MTARFGAARRAVNRLPETVRVVAGIVALVLVGLRSVVVDPATDACAVEPNRPIHVDVSAGQVVVTGDKTQLRQVLGNLVANLRVHTGPGTAASITLRADDARTGDCKAIVSVADQGPGMTADDAAHVFDRFYRAETSRSRQTGGAGLGLAIVAITLPLALPLTRTEARPD